MRAAYPVILAGLITLTACTTQSPELATEDAPPTAADTSSAVLQPSTWQTVSPGGETRCTDGSEFHFKVRQADPEKLLFYLEGGGGCWNKASCDPKGSPTAKLNLEGQEEPREGIFDFNNEDNPFADYSVVYVPYCSGDVHIGANDVIYPGKDASDPPLSVFHRGRANVQSAIDWVVANSGAQSDIFVTGISAGAVPTPLYASILANEYPGARVAALSDGAGGYRRLRPMTDRLKDWGVFNHIDSVKGFEGLEPSKFTYEQIFIHAARSHPDITYARFDFSADPAQWRFLSGNSEFESLLGNLKANNDDIRSVDPDFRGYITGGAFHTILDKSGFYEVTEQGVSLVEWVELLARHEPVGDVTCRACD